MHQGDEFKVDFVMNGEDGIVSEKQDTEVQNFQSVSGSRPQTLYYLHHVLSTQLPGTRLVPYCKPNPTCANDGFHDQATVDGWEKAEGQFGQSLQLANR
jgi:hypothetical protein